MPSPPSCWRSPEELLELAVERSRLVLVNEAHNGMLRSRRTREIGLRMVTRAHQLGVRHLAMEALQPLVAEQANQTRQLRDAPGYLGQPEMRTLVQRVLDDGWELIAYEADMSRKPADLGPLSNEETNWRDREQAKNLSEAFRRLPATAVLMVWCGNHHLAKSVSDWWHPMGSQLSALTGIEPFTIDQTRSVQFVPERTRLGTLWADTFADKLAAMGDTAGFLATEAPADWPVELETADAYLLSIDNEMV